MADEIIKLAVDDGFWDTAFDENSPFRREFLTEFRRGLVEGAESDLAWARLAIHAITDCALWLVVLRMNELAAGMPRAEFVESLSFFLASDRTLVRLRENAKGVPNLEFQKALMHLNRLQLELRNLGDHDLSGRLEQFRNLIILLTEKA
jgi:hypothetical protein